MLASFLPFSAIDTSPRIQFRTRPPYPRSQVSRLSIAEHESRRRLMWTCYQIDTLSGSGAKQHGFLFECDVRIQLVMIGMLDCESLELQKHFEQVKY